MEYSFTKDLLQTNTSELNKQSASYTNFINSFNNSELQDKLAVLARKRYELRELKILQENYRAKGQEQQGRLEDLQIQMNHLIELQNVWKTKIERCSKQVAEYRRINRQILQQVDLLQKQFEGSIMPNQKLKNKIKKLNRQYREIEQQIIEREQQKYFMENKIVQIQQLNTKNQNKLREKQDFLTKLKIEQTQFTSMIRYLETRTIQTMKSRNQTNAHNKSLDNKLKFLKTKQHIMLKQKNDVDWEIQRTIQKNFQIDQINTKLTDDLVAVSQHLAMLQKTNKLLNSSLQQYGMTGQKIFKLIAKVTQIQ